MTSPRRLISIVSPVFNESVGLAHFQARISALWRSLPQFDHEIVYVDDGSSDGSFELLRSMAVADERIRVFRLSRNFGHQVAITCGIDHARGDAVVVIDSDLQDPPEVIVEMVEVWERGAEVVFGQRRAREGERMLKRLTATAYYRVLARLAEFDIPVDSGDFRLMSRPVVDALNQLREESRYIRGLVAWVGFRQEAVLYDRDARTSGESSYSLGRMLRLAIDGLTSFSDRPLRLATGLGALVSGAAFLGALYIIMSKVLAPESSVPGFAALAVLVLFMGGVQLMFVGVLGEYLGRVFRETKRRPLYFVMEAIDRGSQQS